jgi:transketolase
VEVAAELEVRGKHVRVVSMPCWELFEQQDDEYKQSVLGGNIGTRVAIEAGTSFGWHKWIGPHGIAVTVDRFGASAPMSDLAKEYGFTVDAIIERLIG